MRPDAAMGYAACLDSEKNMERNGNVGAGMGATVGKIHGDKFAMKSGLGCYCLQVGSLQVGAIVVVNVIGDVFEMDSQKQLAGLDKAEMNKVAAMASNGLARTIRPVNTSMDGGFHLCAFGRKSKIKSGRCRNAGGACGWESGKPCGSGGGRKIWV